MKIAILKYKAGNIYSVINSLKRLGVEPVVTDDVNEVMTADKVILPGQGEAKSVMQYLYSHNLNEVICNLRQPVLGICIGMQLMCRHSEEGDADGLGIFDAEVRRFASTRHEDKVPHMGWNTVSRICGPLFDGLGQEEYVYFVHSYYVPLHPCTAAVTDYIQPFSAALHKENFYATQFHPEKSGSVGERILHNFLTL